LLLDFFSSGVPHLSTLDCLVHLCSPQSFTSNLQFLSSLLHRGGNSALIFSVHTQQSTHLNRACHPWRVLFPAYLNTPQAQHLSHLLRRTLINQVISILSGNNDTRDLYFFFLFLLSFGSGMSPKDPRTRGFNLNFPRRSHSSSPQVLKFGWGRPCRRVTELQYYFHSLTNKAGAVYMLY
jgi:hypothetical protein